MPKIAFGLLSLLIVSLAINVLQYIKYDNDMTLSAALCNYKATSSLFLVRAHNDENLRKLLKYDLVQLVHDYDENKFKKSKVLSSICKDWKRLIQKPIKEYLEESNNRDTQYYHQVSDHYNFLNTKCQNMYGLRKRNM